MSHCSCFWAKPYLLLFCYAMCFTEKQQIPVLYSGLLCASQRSNKYQFYTLVCYVLHREATNTSFILWFAMCFTEKQQIPVLYSGLLCASQRSNKYQFYTLVCYVLHREATNTSFILWFDSTDWIPSVMWC